jgi:hypothetical protein
LGKRKDIAAARFLLVDWRKRRGWCRSVGKIKLLGYCLLATWLLARTRDKRSRNRRRPPCFGGVKGKEEPDLLWLFGLEGRGTWQEGAWDWYKKQQQRKSQRWLLDSNLERNWAGVEWEVAAASDSELGLLFQPAKAIN